LRIRRQRLELAELVLEHPRAPDPVDRLVARRRRYPGARVVRDAAPWPDLERDEEGVLYRLLGEVEVAEDADERRDRPSRLLSEQAVDGLCPDFLRYAAAPASFEWASEPADS
jgi:hypothetical protein